jgi:sulfate permease, SulP family
VSHALVLAVMMAALSGVVSRVPLVALAGVLLVTAARMVDRHAVTAVLRSTRTDALVLVLTAGSTIVLDLVRAVEIGIVVAVVVALVRLARTAQVVDDTASVLEVSHPQEHELLRRHVLVYRIDGPLFFAATTRFLREFAAVADVRVVVLRLANVAMLDASGAKAVAQIVGDLQDRHVGVVLKVANAEHTRLLRAVGALQGLEQRGQVLTDLPAALEVARALAARPTSTTVAASLTGAATVRVESCGGVAAEA